MENIKKSNTNYIREARRMRAKRRHQIRIRRRIALLSLFSIFTLIISVFCVSTQSQAENIDMVQSSKYFKSIMIEKGDTLWSIANENIDAEHYNNTSEYIKEVKSINSLATDKITAGNYIIVPYYSEEIYANAVNADY